VRRLVSVLLLVPSLVALNGCGEETLPKPKAPDSRTSTPARLPPSVPGLNDSESSADVLLVERGPRKRADRYRTVERMDAGALRIICRIPNVKAPLPPRKRITFTGPTAIKNPITVKPYKVIHDGIRSRGYDIKNELDYYKNWNPPVVDRPTNWLSYPQRGQRVLSVSGVAIIVEGIKQGAREE